MDSKADSSSSQHLAAQFAELCQNGLSAPDVFTFLAAYPGASALDRLDVLLADQRLRWTRGQPLALRVYLSAFPDIAARGEMVRALVDGERSGRRRSAARLNDTIALQAAGPASDDSTQTFQGGPARDDTETDNPRPIPTEPPTGRLLLRAGEQQRTKGPSSVHETEQRLSFALDEAHQLQAEAEKLSAMLNRVRFTLVRRLGAGGMGVVYEAYDQERGELVALKTMRRVGPASLVRFKEEFRSLSDISHPNLVNLYELFAVEDRWFFTMELVEGWNFVDYVRRSGDPAGDGKALEESKSGVEQGAARDLDSAPRQPEQRPFDEPRLRDALAQLAEGVEALHQSGKLHRDIKPPNVLVTSEGRVVLLDFGLTADVEGAGKPQIGRRQIVGTIAHMSPEQAAGLAITTASDWYSVGVVLFEAMTGQLPFRGSTEEIAAAKRFGVAPAPGAVAENLPADLACLCSRLLDQDPDKRPTGREIIAQLRGEDEQTQSVPEPSRPLPLIGRSRHRQVLDASFSALGFEKTVSVFVFGRTGTGKTTLVRSFLDELTDKEDAVVLCGRCYERESVPYKALDSLIDALARYLKGLPPREAAGLLPPDVAFLARLFPVLQSVEAIALARSGAAEMPDQRELRRNAFSALRELLRKIGQRAPLVLAIDDLQWGDVDSAMLLAELFCAAEPPVLLFIGCFRLEDAERSPFLREMRRPIAGEHPGLDHRELAVEPLTQAESRELALLLLERDDAVSRAQAHVVARESGGNPLFVVELVKHIQSGEPTERWDAIGRLDLDEVLWARIRRQPKDAQRLLATVAVSGRPIRQALAFEAAELGTGARGALAVLRTERLVRCIGESHQGEIETYHDRIRETVVAHLPAQTLKYQHRRLSLVLASTAGVDAEILAEHLHGAGELARACDCYTRAAAQASAALAFDHAVRLYRSALDLYEGPAATARDLWKKLGDALVNAGRGSEAAQAFLKAADSASAAETLELKRLASTQLLLSGHLDEGLSLLRTLLGPLGLSMPDTLPQARFSLLWHRALLRLRGLSFRERTLSQVPQLDLARIDLCWSAVAGLSMIEPIRGADFQARGLLFALRAGEPFRIARALAMEAGHRCSAGTAAAPHVASLLNRAETLADRLDSAHARGIVKLVRGASAVMLGQWKSAQTALDEAEHLLRNHCTGVAWERDTVHNFALLTLLRLGELGELKRRWTVLYREAQERGDLYAANVLTTLYMTMIKLARNEPFDSDSELEAALARRDRQGFNLQHSAAIESLFNLHLYQGEVSKAWLRTTAAWPEYQRSGLLRIQLIRIQMLEHRARAALAMAEKASQSEPYLRQAKRDARALESEGATWALAHAHFIRAGIAACREDAIRAIEELIQAAARYSEADMRLQAQVMKYRLGEIQIDPESRARRAEAELQIRALGVASPLRWAGMCAPGFAKISNESTETTY